MRISSERIEEVVVRAVFQDGLDELASKLNERELFTGKAQASYAMLDQEGHGTIYYGLGKESDLTPYQILKLFVQLAKLLDKLAIHRVHLELPEVIGKDEAQLSQAILGLQLAAYRFDTYKSKPENKQTELEISLEVEAPIEETANLAAGVFTARDLVNRRPNDLYPASLAAHVRQLFADSQVEVEILEKCEIEALGMEAFLAVNQGSDHEPRFIVMKYLPKADEQPIALVGKGVTYDSGGYAIKPASSMKAMHSDMAGAAAVVGAMEAISSNQLPCNVIGVIAATENLIDGKAFKNGDIVGSMKGSTIEVNNTDAEGRLTLADALYYAATKLEPKAIVDLATLTGAAIAAVSGKCTAMIASDDSLAQAVLQASEAAAEPTQRLLAFPSHYEQIKGTYADLDNSPAGGGGCITAGVFLEHFTEGIPWVHLDIAGPSYNGTGYDYLPKGASGTGVMTLYQWIKSQK